MLSFFFPHIIFSIVPKGEFPLYKVFTKENFLALVKQTLVKHVQLALAKCFSTTCTFGLKDKIEYKKFSKFCDFLFSLLMFLVSHFTNMGVDSIFLNLVYILILMWILFYFSSQLLLHWILDTKFLMNDLVE